MWHGAWYMGHVAWGMLYAHHLFSGPHVAWGHWAWDIGPGAWGMWRVACDMGHVAWCTWYGACGMGHVAWVMWHGACDRQKPMDIWAWAM